MKYSSKEFIAGALVATGLTVISLVIGGFLGTNAKRDACTKFGEVTGEQTTFITYGLTESKCFANINAQWLDINP